MGALDWVWESRKGIPASTVAMAAIIVVAVLTGIVAFAIIQDSREALAQTVQTDLDLQTALTLIVDQETGVRGFTATGQQLFLEPYRGAALQFGALTVQLRADAGRGTLRQALPAIDDMGATHRRWLATVAEPLIVNPHRGDAGRLLVAGKTLADRMRRDIATARHVADQAWEETKRTAVFSIIISIAVIIFFLVVLGAIGIASDGRRFARERRLRAEVDERNRALVLSNSALQEFAYVASHDLQEPLRAVASFTQLLQKRYHGKLDQDANEFIDYAVDGAQRMQQLINDILQYSRVTTRGKPLEPVDLRTCVDSALQNLQMAVRDRQAEVDIGPMPRVIGDEAQLVQLMQNLFGNALKYCQRDDPRVEIRAQRDGGWWVVSVRDSGIGIAPEYHERIFRIFQRLHTRAEYAGTGIGLAICKGIVDRHGGHIWVDSNEGQGATFSFTLRALSSSEEIR